MSIHGLGSAPAALAEELRALAEHTVRRGDEPVSKYAAAGVAALERALVSRSGSDWIQWLAHLCGAWERYQADGAGALMTLLGDRVFLSPDHLRQPLADRLPPPAAFDGDALVLTYPDATQPTRVFLSPQALVLPPLFEFLLHADPQRVQRGLARLGEAEATLKIVKAVANDWQRLLYDRLECFRSEAGDDLWSQDLLRRLGRLKRGLLEHADATLSESDQLLEEWPRLYRALNDDAVLAFWLTQTDPDANLDPKGAFRFFATTARYAEALYEVSWLAEDKLSVRGARSLGVPFEDGGLPEDQLEPGSEDLAAVLDDAGEDLVAQLAKGPLNRVKWLNDKELAELAPLVARPWARRCLPITRYRSVRFGALQDSLNRTSRPETAALRLRELDAVSPAAFVENLSNWGERLAKPLAATLHVLLSLESDEGLSALVQRPDVREIECVARARDAIVEAFGDFEEAWQPENAPRRAAIIRAFYRDLKRDRLADPELGAILKFYQTAWRRNQREGFRALPEADARIDAEPAVKVWEQGYRVLVQIRSSLDELSRVVRARAASGAEPGVPDWNKIEAEDSLIRARIHELLGAKT